MTHARGWALEAAALLALATASLPSAPAQGRCPYQGHASIMVMQNHARMTYTMPVSTAHPNYHTPSYTHVSTPHYTSNTHATPGHSTGYHTSAIHLEYVNQHATSLHTSPHTLVQRTREISTSRSSHLETDTMRRIHEEIFHESRSTPHHSHDWATRHLDLHWHTEGPGPGPTRDLHVHLLYKQKTAEYGEKKTMHTRVFRYEDKQTLTSSSQRVQTHEKETVALTHRETPSSKESHSSKLVLHLNHTRQSKTETPTLKESHSVSHTHTVKREPPRATPPLKPETPKTVTRTEVTREVKGKFTFTCGKCHFSVPATSQPHHPTTSHPSRPTDPHPTKTPEHESRTPRLVETPKVSSVPVVSRHSQVAAPYPLDTHKHQTPSVLPKVAHESRTVMHDPGKAVEPRKSLPSTIESAPQHRSSRVPSVVAQLLNSEAMSHRSHPSMVGYVMMPPVLPSNSLNVNSAAGVPCGATMSTISPPESSSSVDPVMSTYRQLQDSQPERPRTPQRSMDTVIVKSPGSPRITPVMSRGSFGGATTSSLDSAISLTTSLRLSPETVLAMPPLPSGLPVLPPTSDAPALVSAQTSLLESVMQPPPIPSEGE